MATKVTKDDVISFIENMTVIELSEMVKELEEKFGVSAAAAAMPVTASGGADAAAPESEEKTEFNVVLTSVGDKKIQVIKEVRAITGLGLKEAKELVDNAPNPVKEGIPEKDAEEIKQKLEEVGASVEVK
jgi:large subunit ribosomal protein L7/L12